MLRGAGHQHPPHRRLGARRRDLPREALSLSQAAGQRTAVNGFVPPGWSSTGGWSRRSAAAFPSSPPLLFNAAYLAGLDFLEYQSHSLYFTRYPYGREAALSWPAPDLVVENNTDYPVLVWPSYSDTSITVQLWSTKNVNVVETSLQETALRCTKVERFRTRTFSDGRRERDSVFAVYRPDEGSTATARGRARPLVWSPGTSSGSTSASIGLGQGAQLGGRLG